MKKILSKLITSVICVGVIAWLVMGSVTASFSDAASTQNSTFTAGILDLKTNDANGVTNTLSNIGFIPGESIATQTITLKNAGNLNGSALSITVTYVENDGTNPPGYNTNMTANNVASLIHITTLTYGATNLLSDVTNSNGTAYIDLQDVSAANLTGLSGIDAESTKDFTIAAQLDSNAAGTSLEADGVAVTITFTLEQ